MSGSAREARQEIERIIDTIAAARFQMQSARELLSDAAADINRLESNSGYARGTLVILGNIDGSLADGIQGAASAHRYLDDLRISL